MNCFPLKFLDTTTSVLLMDYLLNEVEDPAFGLAVMDYLKANRPAVANEVLCLIYGIAWYQVGKVYPETAPKGEHFMWFVSTPDNDEWPEVSIPLSETAAGAIAQAVQHLGLEAKFYGKEVTPA